MITKRRIRVAIMSAAFVYAALASASCVSNRIDMSIIKNTTSEEKADILFAKGKALYVDEIKIKNNLDVIKDARQMLTDALTLNPAHPEAKEYLDAIDAYVAAKVSVNKETATKLYAKENRTEAENYRLIQALTIATTLDKNDKDLQKIQNSTKDVKTSVLTTKENQLAALQEKIVAEKAETQLAKQLREAEAIIREIKQIDPANAKADDAREINAKTADTLVQKDIDAANQALAAKKYADAETAILRAEKNLASVSQDPGPTIPGIKYRVYYGWAQSTYAAKNYKTASDKIVRAIRASRTQEAATLKANIDKALATRDYDAEIKTILASVDESLAKKDPATAMRLISDNAPKMKVQANADSLNAKKADVTAQLKALYQDGISRYNEEDYEGARVKFQAVVDVQADYEQAQAYLDRTNTKLRALTGKD